MSLSLTDNIRLNDYPNMTRRQNHAANLAYIAEVGGDYYYRAMSYQEASNWIADFEYYTDDGFPTDIAAQYSWDHYFAGRKAKV